VQNSNRALSHHYQQDKELNRHGLSTQDFHRKMHYGEAGAPPENHKEALEWVVDFLATGISQAKLVHTVSQPFLDEIDEGMFLGDDYPAFNDYTTQAIRKRIHKNYGPGENPLEGRDVFESHAIAILNALDQSDNPENDPRLHVQYGPDKMMEGKAANKAYIQKKLGMKVDPNAKMGSWVSRLQRQQKHVEIVVDNIDPAMKKYADMGLQLVFIADPADGDYCMVEAVQRAQNRYDGLIGLAGFDEALNITGLAASDFTFMPSGYEPCGLVQFLGLMYGTRTIGHATGGLKVLKDYAQNPDTGNAHLFKNLDKGGFMYGLDQAMLWEQRPPEEREAHLVRAQEEYVTEHSGKEMFMEYHDKMYEPLLGMPLIDKPA